MPRVKRGITHIKKRRKLMKRVKGFRGGLKNRIKLAKTADTRAGMHAYRDRRVKKRNMRRLWQVQINAAIRALGGSYSTFIGGLKKKDVEIDRKVLSKIAQDHPKVFEKIAEFVK
ncbi:MAG: 50S ribosomal protein L20 [Candidatus Magasanikbacteria bacterium]